VILLIVDLLMTLFSVPSLRVRNHISHPYRTTDKIIVLYVSVEIFREKIER